MMTLEKYMQEIKESKTEEDVKTHIDWLNGYREEWMTDDQWLMSLFLCRLFNGFHHTPTIKQCGQSSICVNTRTAYFSNFDYDYLTKAVIMAHNWGIRIEIRGSGPGMFKLQLWKRHKRTGGMAERMPTIQDMVERYKDY